MPEDVWSDADALERYVGRWSRKVAAAFVEWMEPAAGLRWLDVGCGSGVLAQTILRDTAPAAVHGIDSSPAYAAHAARLTDDPRATFAEGDAQAIAADDGAFDAAVSGLVLNFLPDPGRGVREMARVTAPGGVVASYVWDYAGEMQLMRRFWDAAVALAPEDAHLDEGRRMTTAQPDVLASLFTAAGLGGVETRAIDVPTVFAGFDDYWEPFLGGQGPAPGYCVSLPEGRRAELRERLRETLPAAPDGSIRLIARAWAVRGMCPD